VAVPFSAAVNELPVSVAVPVTAIRSWSPQEFGPPNSKLIVPVLVKPAVKLRHSKPVPAGLAYPAPTFPALVNNVLL